VGVLGTASGRSFASRFVPTDALGTWDTLPINGGPYATQSDRELPVFLTDPFGRYGSIDGVIWQYPMETVTLLTLPDQITDAFMAIISGAELSDTDVAVPYGPEYSIRNGSLGKGVCYAQELTSAYATRVLEAGEGILSYSDVVAACATN